MKNRRLVTLLIAVLSPAIPYGAAQQGPAIPHLETRDNHHALIVDGHPYLLLGAQINNSSAWPATLPAAWAAAEAMHVNTVEAPVYWEQMEPARGTFDFSSVDLLVIQAREHHLHLVLLWFGTWKNGQNHYVPEWIKSDTKTYPRELDAYGKLLDVMSPVSPANRDADRAAFTAFMHHLKQLDSTDHTVLMIQVENESGSVGSVRDFSPAAQRLFEAPVPAELTRALHLPTGRNWTQTFRADADESFAAYTTAHYINSVAASGKAEYPLPMYCNVWIVYPVHALETRTRAYPGQEYPSGGPQQPNVAIWKAAAPAIDLLAPDFYSDDALLFRETVAVYRRPDNPIFVPETRTDANFGRYLFYALGSEAIGFSPFGIDRAQPQPAAPGAEAALAPTAAPAARPASAADNFALLNPIGPILAQLSFEGHLQTAVEEKGAARQTLHFSFSNGTPGVDAVASFGFPQSDGAQPPGTSTLQGRALVAQLGPLEFLVTGFDTSVSFHLPNAPGSPSAFSPENRNPAPPQTQQLEILRAEEGHYSDGTWLTTRILNGDQTDRGLQFRGSSPPVVRILFHTIPLYDDSLRRP